MKSPKDTVVRASIVVDGNFTKGMADYPSWESLLAELRQIFESPELPETQLVEICLVYPKLLRDLGVMED